MTDSFIELKLKFQQDGGKVAEWMNRHNELKVRHH